VQEDGHPSGPSLTLARPSATILGDLRSSEDSERSCRGYELPRMPRMRTSPYRVSRKFALRALRKAAVLPLLSAGSERLPAFPFNAVQHLLRLREKLVELVFRSANVDEHRLAPDVHDDEPVLPSIVTCDRGFFAEKIEWNTR
jgi:hypothetical protein